MKRFFTFLFIVFCETPLLFAQVGLTKNSHGLISDQIHECQNVEYQLPGDAGRDLVWDFSQATALDKAYSGTILRDHIGEVGNVTAYREDDNVSFFYNVTSDVNEYWGYQTEDVVLQLTKPIVKTTYPQIFGTQFDGEYEGTFTLKGSDRTTPVKGLYSTHADATGTIILPGDVALPALRVKTTETSATGEMIKYLWYAQSERFPIFITMEQYAIAKNGTRTLKSTKSYTNVLAKALTAVEKPDAGVTYNVSPNPFVNEIRLTYSLSETSNVSVELYNQAGVKLATLISEVQNGNVSVAKNISQYTQADGVYLLKIKLGDKVYTEKLLKAHK